jgi:hypothetical protein
MRLLPPTASLLATLALACAPTTPVDNWPDAGPTRKKILFDFGGHVRLHPIEVAWRTQNGTLEDAPSLVGLELKVEDATSARSGKPALKTVTTTEDGAWFAPEVDVAVVSVAIVASAKGPGLFDSAFGIQRGRPTASKLDLTTWVLSAAFVDHIAAAVGGDTAAFKENGFAFGQITTASGAAVPGAKLGLAQNPPIEFSGTETVKLYYPNDDLTGLNSSAQTAAMGLLILENAGDAEDYTALAEGKKFENRLTGSRSNAVVSFFIAEKPQ